jgi:hypothetical protein
MDGRRRRAHRGLLQSAEAALRAQLHGLSNTRRPGPSSPKRPSEIEVVSGDQIDHAHDQVVGSDVRYRFVIDTATF